MADRKFYIKVNGYWSKDNEWNTESSKLYFNSSLIGKAYSLQDATELAKSHCNADKNSIIEMSN